MEPNELSLEQFASIAAALEVGLPRDEVLARAALSNEGWEEARRRWLGRLAAQAASGNVRSCVRYTERLRAHKAAAAKMGRDAREKREGAVPLVPSARLARLTMGSRAPAALPAPGAVPAAAPPVPPAAPTPKGRRPLAETDNFVSPVAAARPALPFQAAPEVLKKAPPARSLAETDVFVSPAAIARPAMPFASKQSPPNAAPAPIRPPGPELPFKDVRVARPTRRADSFTLAEYAKICATVRAFPDQVAQIRGHYGLDAEGWRAMHALWRDRFEKDAALEARWHTLVERNLRSGPG